MISTMHISSPCAPAAGRAAVPDGVSVGVLAGEVSRMRLSIVVSVCALVLTGCDRRVRAPAPEPITAHPQPKSDAIEADIFYDATPSMKGFTAGGDGAFYARVIRKLESALNKEWPAAPVRLLRFGSRVQEWPTGDRLAPLRPAFYEAKPGFAETHLNLAIDEASTSRLTVIITDLFQTDTDVTRVTRQIVEKFVVAGLAIGIVGIRSDFDGTVFDVGIDRERFPYKGLRPFYVLVLGGQADVGAYLRALEADELGASPETHFLMLSPHLLRALPEVGRAAQTARLDEVDWLVAKGPSHQFVRQFRILRDATDASFRTSFSLDLCPYRMGIETSAMQPEVTAQTVVSGKLAAASEMVHSFKIADVAVQGRSAGPKQETGYELQLGVNLNTSAMLRNTIYRLEVKLVPPAGAYLTPLWVREWDMDVTRIPQWKRDPRTFDGSTTLNLGRLINDIWQATVQRHKPRLAHFFCYLTKRG